MKKLKHSWKDTTSQIPQEKQCIFCGIVKYWDFDYNCMMYKWGMHVTYRAPSCIGMNGRPYNSIEIQAVKK